MLNQEWRPLLSRVTEGTGGSSSKLRMVASLESLREKAKRQEISSKLRVAASLESLREQEEVLANREWRPLLARVTEGTGRSSSKQRVWASLESLREQEEVLANRECGPRSSHCCRGTSRSDRDMAGSNGSQLAHG